MGRPKGGTRKSYTVEEKLNAINQLLEGKTTREVGKILNIHHSMLCRWLQKYNELGEKGLEHKKTMGNSLFMKYSKKKQLTEIEKLEYENLKLRIENKQLKKGYVVKGDGSIVVFKK